MIDDYSGLQKAAILLITLGPEKASAIFQHLKEDEIESLTLEIANTRSVSPQDKESVLDEYYQVCLAQQYIAEGGIGYAKELLEKALGSEKAQGVISKLTASLQVRPFEFVRKTEPAQLLNFIQDEHPQTIAMILSYLSSSQAAMILGALPPEKQADVARRIAQMDRTSPDVIKEVERVLERKLSSLVNQDYTIVGGIDSIVNILNNSSLYSVSTDEYYDAIVNSSTFSSLIAKLPKIEDLTIDSKGSIEEARKLYDGLSDYGKQFINASDYSKLQAYEDKLKELIAADKNNQADSKENDTNQTA